VALALLFSAAPIIRVHPRLSLFFASLAFFAVLLLSFAWIAGKAGLNGRPRTVASSLFWPFYVDTWFIPADRWSLRALLPVATMAALWPLLRKWLRSPSLALLVGLAIAAWVYHLSVGIVRHGVVEGLTFTFHRPQEYWWDVHYVDSTFLAKFPDLRLSQHGGTHPPGVILFLALIQKLGFTSMLSAELVCTPLAALGAFPVWGAARRLAPSEGDEIARWAVVLYLFGCSIVAFSVLSMDMLIVLLGALALYGFARALDGDLAGGALSGLGLAAASLCSFLALTLPITWAVLWLCRRPRRYAPIAVAIGVFIAFYGGLALLGYRPFHVFVACVDALAHSDDRTRSRWLALIGNPIAFFGSLGVAFTGLAAHALYRALQQARHRRLDDTGWSAR